MIRVLFLIHEFGTLDHAIALKEQIEKAGGKVSLSLIGSQQYLPEWANSSFLNCEKIDSLSLHHRLSEFDGIWFQDPYEERRHHTWKTKSYKAKTIYSGYGIPLSNWDYGHYQLDFYKKCDHIMTSSPYSKKMFEIHGCDPLNVFWSGDPLLFKINEILNQKLPLVHEPYGITNKNLTILWAPHWTEKWVDGSRGFYRLLEIANLISRYLQKNSDTQIILRGHPHLKLSDFSASKSEKNFLNLLQSENLEISTKSLVEDVLRADALITDGVSILSYFGITGKKIAMHSSSISSAPFNNAGRAIINTVEPLTNLKSLSAWIAAINTFDIVSNSATKEIVERLFPLNFESPGIKLIERLRI